LDSTAALRLGKLMKSLAASGRTVISTLHQPSSSLFFLFDKAIVMAAGEIAYFGPTFDVGEALAPMGMRCPIHENPADWIIAVVSDEQMGLFLAGNKQTGVDEKESLEIKEMVDEKSSYNTTLLEQMKILFARAMKTTLRDKVLTRARVGSHILMALLIGFLYWRMETDQTAIQDRLSLIFFALIFLMLTAMMPTVLTFPLEKAVFLREHNNHWYTVTAYYISRSFVDIPLQVVIPWLFGTIIFFMTNVYPDVNHSDTAVVYFQFVAVLVVMTNVTQALGIVIGIAAPSVQVGIFMAPMTALPNLLFCGFLVNLDNIGPWLSWIKYISFIKYAMQAAVLSIFQKITFTCKPNQLVGPQGICPITSGQTVLNNLDYNDLSWGDAMLVLLLWFVFFRVIGYVILLRKAKTG